MKSFQCTILCFFLSISAGFSQNADFNLTFISNVPFSEGSNDIWGYVDQDGVEYAVHGTRSATVVLSLEDPSNPDQVYRVDGSTTTWRDMKTWGTHIYSVCDNCGDGLTIIDMTDPDSITHVIYETIFDSVTNETLDIGSTHNIYIDEFGYLYLAGGEERNGGILIFDVHTNPGNPTVAGYGDARYSHDVYVRDNLMYSSDIYAGFLSIQDVTDKRDVQLLATQPTTGDFTHNAWLSDDGNYVFTTDEIANGFLDAYDISDFNDIKRVDVYQPPSTTNEGVIPHNTHVLNDYLVTSWYTDGIKVIDGQHPDNLIEVASFDTWGGANGGFNGNWGAYPFLPSGLLLVSDIQAGLFVFEPNYKRASYLEGRVTEPIGGNGIPEVQVKIVGDFPNAGQTNNFGDYKTGISQEDQLMVEFSHPLYRDTSIAVDFISDSIQILDVVMQPLFSSVNVLATVIDVNGEPVENAKVELNSQFVSYEFLSDANGNIDEQVLDIEYAVLAALWGYGDTLFVVNDIPDGPIAVQLPGDGLFYLDRFIANQDWGISNNAETGFWERGNPIGTEFQGPLSPSTDSPWDLGSTCYVTGIAATSPFDNDVDGTYNWMFSPTVQFDGNEVAAELTFDYWFRNVDNNGPVNDTLDVFLFLDGNVVARPWMMPASDTTWRQSGVIDLIDVLSPISGGVGEVQIGFRVGDENPGSPLEAAIDNVLIKLERASSTTTPAQELGITVYPNPFLDEFYVDLSASENDIVRIDVLNSIGQLVETAYPSSSIEQVSISQAPGLYTVRMIDKHEKVAVEQLMKL